MKSKGGFDFTTTAALLQMSHPSRGAVPSDGGRDLEARFPEALRGKLIPILIYKGWQLQDDRTLSQCGIDDCSLVFLVLRLRGDIGA
eukprot:12255555-Karenia_brevis.AAC.1